MEPQDDIKVFWYNLGTSIVEEAYAGKKSINIICDALAKIRCITDPSDEILRITDILVKLLHIQQGSNLLTETSTFDYREYFMIEGQHSDIAIQKEEESSIRNKITSLNALACGFSQDSNCDVNDAKKESDTGLKALAAKGSLQEMLAAQMLSIHEHQQTSMAMANRTMEPSSRQYFINSGMKLANTFVQQATLLNKLQGNAEAKVTVGRVDVHSGGQAVVGNVSTTNSAEKVKK